MLALLTGPRAGEPLSLAVATLRVELRDHEVHSVQHRPGDGVTVGYRVWLLHDSGELVEDYVLLSSTAGRDVPDDAPHVVQHGRAVRSAARLAPPSRPGAARPGHRLRPPRARGRAAGDRAGHQHRARRLPTPAPGRRARGPRDGRHVLRQGAAAGGRARWCPGRHPPTRPCSPGPASRFRASSSCGTMGSSCSSRRSAAPLVEAIGVDAARGVELADLVAPPGRAATGGARPPATAGVVGPRAGLRGCRGRLGRRTVTGRSPWGGRCTSGRGSWTSGRWSRPTGTSTRASSR